MSNRSRARYRAEADDDAEAVDPAEAERVAEAKAAMDDPNKRAGLAKLIDVVMRSRDDGKAPPAELITGASRVDEARRIAAAAPRPEPMREPTPFEAAILFALGNRTTVIDCGSRPPMEVPVAVASGGMYGGTVEPERIAHRRRRNKVARASRRGRQRRTTGRVYRSRFGYPIHVPGITPPVDAEVVDE